MNKREEFLEEKINKHCSILSPQERESFKRYLLKNDDLMKDLTSLWSENDKL